MRYPRSLSGAVAGALIAMLAAAAVWHAATPGRSGGSASPPGAGRTAGTLRPPTLPDPRHRMLLGAFTGLAGQVSTEASVEQREAAMGRHYDLELTYYNWTDPFPDDGEATIVARGRTPVMTWYGPGKAPGDHRTLAEINDGGQDGWIRRQAEAIKRFGHPIFLRPMIEMNGNWYRGYSGHPAAFIAAWRRIHDIFEQVGATNVSWVWCPNVTPQNWDAYYPGNAYVDVIGVDGYNYTARQPDQSFQQIFGPFLAHFAGRKPLMIGETASDSARGSAAAYIDGMRTYLQDVAGPRYDVIAVCWFDTDLADGHHNWRLDQTPQAWRAWLSLARDPYFGGNG